MSEEHDEPTPGERREWLGEPHEHGGDYRPSRVPGYFADAGCCLIETIGAFGGLALVVILLF